MQNTPANDNQELADNIFGASIYEAPERQKKDFSPWHKPRKQYVRHHQWCVQIEKLLNDMQPDGNTLKYLGLPGNDLLDLRYFQSQICQPRQMGLRFLGFNRSAGPNNAAQTELNISLDEVKKLPLIDPRSIIIWDNFSLLSNEQSKAWHQARDFGPYDVINLDLCDGFGADEPGSLADTHYNAVNRLLALQAKNKLPWLLFLTTRTRKQDIHTEVLQKLVGKYAQNLIDCATFKDASAQAFSIIDAAGLETATETPEGHLVVFLAGLCKWIFGLAVQPPPSKVELKSVIGYRINSKAAHDDIVSLALKFEPTIAPLEDPLGLANLSYVAPTECDLSTKALKRLVNRKSADQILAADANLHGEMVAATKTLLALARYDPDAYQAWLQTV